jgi:hypothetical protein
MMAMAPEAWVGQSERDYRRNELVDPDSGEVVTYEQLLAGARPEIAREVNPETFARRYEAINAGLDDLKARFGGLSPDIVVMFGDDQSEWFFDDNYPSIHVYWGKSIRMSGHRAGGGEEAAAPEPAREYPVDSALGLHLIESLMDQDFDISHSQYQRDTYGGSIGPSTWYLNMKRSTPERSFGMPHAYGVPIDRWFAGLEVPIVPITINTCYPPNWISPRRAFALGRAVRRAVESWDVDARVAIACSGGLSHYVVDEQLDRQTLAGLTTADGEILSNLPRKRLQSAATEILNWVATAGAMGEERMDLICYEPGYRTPAGTGVGMACGAWLV